VRGRITVEADAGETRDRRHECMRADIDNGEAVAHRHEQSIQSWIEHAHDVRTRELEGCACACRVDCPHVRRHVPGVVVAQRDVHVPVARIDGDAERLRAGSADAPGLRDGRCKGTNRPWDREDEQRGEHDGESAHAPVRTESFRGRLRR
jgi:hypothetical protein